jgi:hypothetical protein
MLKRLSEAISQSNIEIDSLASETHCPHHSFCNFHPKQKLGGVALSIPLFNPGLRNRADGGQQPLKTF